MKKILVITFQMFLCAHAAAAETQTTTSNSADANHRYLVERTFPAGALDGLDSTIKSKVNANNASVGVRWVQSYANADLTKTYCIYEGPSENAIRIAATLNSLPIDSIVEVPVDLHSESPPHAGKDAVKVEK
jgi:hypothetical protein